MPFTLLFDWWYDDKSSVAATQGYFSLVFSKKVNNQGQHPPFDIHPFNLFLVFALHLFISVANPCLM